MNHKYSLKKNHDISKLLQKHKSVGSKYYAIYYENSQKTRIALSISKKLGKAHFRNYNKRVIREILRNNLQEVDKLDMLIVIKDNSISLTYSEKEKEILRLISKIRRN